MVVTKHYDGSKHYGRVSETPCFPSENSQEISTNYRLLHRNITGAAIFPNKFPGEFCKGFFGGFLGPFLLLKQTFFVRGKNAPKNPQQNSNQNLGASRTKFTLQGCALDLLQFPD